MLFSHGDSQLHFLLAKLHGLLSQLATWCFFFYGEKNIFQKKTGLALVQIASMAADFLMVRMYDKDRRDAYYRCKARDENLF